MLGGADNPNGELLSYIIGADINHSKRLWQALHETITREYQCRSMWRLLKKAHHFMKTVSPLPGDSYGLAKVSRY